MPKFSQKSEQQLATCHPDLQRLAKAAIEIIDFGILCGHRSQEDQTKAYLAGYSRAVWPQSLHNTLPSHAFDFFPTPLNFAAHKPYYRIIGVLTACAFQLGIKVRFGADFKSFVDLGHVELV